MKVYLNASAGAAVTLYTNSKQTEFSLNPDGIASEYSSGAKFTVGFKVCSDPGGRYVIVPEECEDAIASISE